MPRRAYSRRIPVTTSPMRSQGGTVSRALLVAHAALRVIATRRGDRRGNYPQPREKTPGVQGLGFRVPAVGELCLPLLLLMLLMLLPQPSHALS